MTSGTKPLASLWIIAALALGLAPLTRAAQSNIVFILADDIGYADLSCTGAEHAKTPAIDKLASQGIRLTNAHSPASTCTPTRRAFLTGTSSWRQKPGSSTAPGDAPLSIPVGTATTPALLKQAGYRTGVVGKWHLGLGPEGGPDWNKDIKPGPLEIGFDYAFIMPATGDRVPCVYIEDHRIVNFNPNDPIKVNYKEKIGSDPTGKENPELLKLKHTHGHDNTIVNGIGRIGWMAGGKTARWKDEEIADTFTKKALSFIEREKNGPFFLYFATHNIHVPRVPNPHHHAKSQCGTRGDAIVELDCAVGEVLSTLDRLKLADNTLVVFTSDNGGVMDDGYEDVGNFDHPCNGTLRGFKGSLWEGGHRVPFIARWPGHIQPGGECGELIAHLDMLATFASLTGQTLPADAAVDSMNVLPALLGQPHNKPVRDNFISHSGGTKGPFSVRQGSWVLVQGGGGKGYAVARNAKAGPKLFNLATDLAQEKDLATENPEKVKELRALVEQLKAAGRSRP